MLYFWMELDVTNHFRFHIARAGQIGRVYKEEILAGWDVFFLNTKPVIVIIVWYKSRKQERMRVPDV